jgi:hypothetical protein
VLTLITNKTLIAITEYGYEGSFISSMPYNQQPPVEISLPHTMATQGPSLGYHDQQDIQAEHPEDIPLHDLNRQYSSQPLHRSDDNDDDEDDHSSVQSFELYTPDEEKALLRKLDTRLVLFLALLYMLSFLDRGSKRIHCLNVRIYY